MPRPMNHPDIKDVQVHQVLHALSDPVRLEIVRLAARHPQLPCNRFLTEIPKSSLSHHWRVLRESGVIRQEGHGTSRLNSLRSKELEARFPGLLQAVLEAARRR